MTEIYPGADEEAKIGSYEGVVKVIEGFRGLYEKYSTGAIQGALQRGLTARKKSLIS